MLVEIPIIVPKTVSRESKVQKTVFRCCVKICKDGYSAPSLLLFPVSVFLNTVNVYSMENYTVCDMHEKHKFTTCKFVVKKSESLVV